MRVFLIAADVAMGLILGLFVSVVAARMWGPLQRPAAAAAICAVCVLVVLFRRPNGSLGQRKEGTRGT